MAPLRLPATSIDLLPSEPWVSVDAVAAHLGVRKDSIYRWIEGRGLPASKIGKLWKLKISEVDAWVRARGASEDGSSAPTAGVHGLVEESGERSKRSFTPASVLVVDDEELVRDTVTDFLRDEGYDAIVAADGAEALRVLASGAALPKLILLDLGMPHMDGHAFREAQLVDPKLAAIPVVVITATPERAPAGTTVIAKPLRLNRLATEIARLLEPSR